MARAACDILLVEDDTDIRETLEAVLIDEGYQVATACNGLDALQRLGSGVSPSLILLDMMMPVMDGEQFLANLRDRGDVLTPVVVVSAAARRPVPGAVAMVRKPIELDALFEVVRQYCGSANDLHAAAAR